LCVHGGISGLVKSLDTIRAIDRLKEVPIGENAFADILWSDPNEGKRKSGNHPGPRGCGILFGEDLVDLFFEENNLTCIVRSHQLAEDGIYEFFDGKVITVWSAPHYCNINTNEAAILEIDSKGKFEVHKFGASEEAKTGAHTDKVVKSTVIKEYFE